MPHDVRIELMVSGRNLLSSRGISEPRISLETLLKVFTIPTYRGQLVFTSAFNLALVGLVRVIPSLGSFPDCLALYRFSFPVLPCRLSCTIFLPRSFSQAFLFTGFADPVLHDLVRRVNDIVCWYGVET